jgi:hypothetical protein
MLGEDCSALDRAADGNGASLTLYPSTSGLPSPADCCKLAGLLPPSMDPPSPP